jgi:hypothetical protein
MLFLVTDMAGLAASTDILSFVSGILFVNAMLETTAKCYQSWFGVLTGNVLDIPSMSQEISF